jgi:hypothetical protein
MKTPKPDKAKSLSKESSTAQDKSLPKPAPLPSTAKDKDLSTVTTDAKDPMTTNQGQPISTDQNSLRAGHRGPTLMEDHVLRETMPCASSMRLTNTAKRLRLAVKALS